MASDRSFGSAQDRFVSRGGIKLQAALDNFQVDVKDKIVLDVGSSTGGFVDCLLQNKAAKVYSLDTAYGELAWKLRNDPRVVVMERTNILHLENLPPPVILRPKAEESLADASHKQVVRSFTDVQDDKVKVDLVTIDAGWTKLELILPIVKKFLKPAGFIIALLKPHYEADSPRYLPRGKAGAGGVGKKDLVKGVLPPEKAEEIKNKVVKTINDLGFTINDQMDSPILGGGGNKEYLLQISIS